MAKRSRKKEPFIRLPKLVEIPAHELQIEDDFVPDVHFAKLYEKFETRKLLATRTRLNIDKIVPGSLERLSDGSAGHHVQDINEKYVFAIAREIRSGHRPTLMLYRGFLDSVSNKFFCPDDQYAFRAYRWLGIQKVPVLILGQEKDLLDESSFVIQGPYYEGMRTFSFERENYASLLTAIVGKETAIKKLSRDELLKVLEGCALEAVGQIEAFHLDGQIQGKIHYHHTLHSVAYRLVESLRAIEVLLINKMSFQIIPIIRVIYELYLNFYVDWLAPESMGPLLQLVASAKGLPAKAGKRSEFKALEEQFGSIIRFCESPAQKAHFSPLGATFHETVYSTLSSAAHQDFRVTERYGMTLESGYPEDISDEQFHVLIRWLDVIVSEVVGRISDDVAHGKLPAT